MSANTNSLAEESIVPIFPDEPTATVTATVTEAALAPTQMQLPKKPMGAFLQFKSDQLGNKWQEMEKEAQQRYTAAYEVDKANGIKRPKSAYFRFVDEQQLSQKWANLDAAEKQRYQTNFTALQKQYLADMQQYDATYATKALSAPALPEKGKQAFLHYANYMRTNRAPELQGKTQQECNALLGKIWAALSDQEKQPYTDIAQRERDAYEAQIKAYELEWGALDYIAKKKEDAACCSSDDNDDGSSVATEEDEVDDSDLLQDEPGTKRKSLSAVAPRPRAKVQRIIDPAEELATQKAKAEKNLIIAHEQYCKHMLESELEKFTRKAMRGKTVPTNLVFNCDAVLAEIKERWDKLSERTRINWVNRATRKKTSRYDSEDDDNALAEIATPDGSQEDDDFSNQDDDDGEDDAEDNGGDEEEDGEEDEDSQAEEVEEGEEEEEQEDGEEGDGGEEEEEGGVEVIGEDDEDSRADDVANYGDDGDDFVCRDDEVEYEDGLTSDDIREAQEKEKALYAALEVGYCGKKKKK